VGQKAEEEEEEEDIHRRSSACSHHTPCHVVLTIKVSKF